MSKLHCFINQLYTLESAEQLTNGMSETTGMTGLIEANVMIELC